MTYDRKLLSAARRELERDREAHEDELEARRRDVYAREPRIRAIDRELSATAIQVLRAALEQGSDPEKAIASLRERNLSLQEERSRLLRGLCLPADWLTNMRARRPANASSAAMPVCSSSSFPPFFPSRIRILKSSISAIIRRGSTRICTTHRWKT